jgi:predicted permease
VLSNYLKIAYRNLFKYKAYSLINIIGLAIGMTCCFLILVWVLDELSFDRFHERSSSLYRAIIRIENDNGVFSSPWGPAALGLGLKREMPEVADSARILPGAKLALHHENTAFYDSILFVDPSFFKMFSFKAVDGDLETALNDLTSVVLTRKMAKKYFGTDKDVLGKVIKLSNKWDYTVKAVIENVPANSHLDFDILAPFAVMKYAGWKDTDWNTNNTITYVQLKKNVPHEAFNEKITHFIAGKMTKVSYKEELFLQPLTRIHLHSDFSGSGSRQGSITQVYILSVIAAFILLIACINFMNLATARSMNRVTEIGVRKIVGAHRSHLIAQFCGESIFLSILALVIALGLAALLLPFFNNLAGKQLSLDLTGNWRIMLGIGLITLFTGLIAGSYPAFFLSALKPARILQGSSRKASKSALLRKALVVLQFALSVILIICTVVIFSQLQYVKNKDLGYDKENLLVLRHDWEPMTEKHKTFRHDLAKHPKIFSAAGTSKNPTNISWGGITFNWRGKNPETQIMIRSNVVTTEYIETMRMQVKEGRGFDEKISMDRQGAVLLNDEAVKLMGFSNPTEETITAGKKKYRVIGVLKKLYFQPVHNKIEPLIILTGKVQGGYTLVRIHPDNMGETIEFVQETWKKHFHTAPFEYHFLDEDYENMYRTEERMGTLLNYFSILAVFIACLGLFGLVSFSTEQRTKEIGIRKVLGATVPGIVMLLGKDFVKLVLLANILAWPVAYYAMNSWLQDFAYRVNINLLVFLVTAVLSAFIALVTVSSQATKAAMANPVKSLRYE